MRSRIIRFGSAALALELGFAKLASISAHYRFTGYPQSLAMKPCTFYILHRRRYSCRYSSTESSLKRNVEMTSLESPRRFMLGKRARDSPDACARYARVCYRMQCAVDAFLR
jgi:hypothetical protein